MLLFLRRQLQIAHDFAATQNAVQAIEMKSRHAIHELRANFRAYLDAELAHRFLIMLVLVYLSQERLGNFRAAQRGEALDLLGVQERQNAWDDRYFHVLLVAQIVLHVEEIAPVVEELGDEEL